MDTVTLLLIAFHMAALATILSFLWNLHREVGNLRKEVDQDMADLRRRMARVESLLEGFASRPQKSPT